LIDAYLVETISRDALAQRDAALKVELDGFIAEKANLERQLSSTVVPENAMNEVLAACERLRAGIEVFTQLDKRYALELLNVSVMVQRGETRDQDKLLITGYFPTMSLDLEADLVHQSSI
jgi:hypothetical protein